jgi:hypothetical protein
MAKSLGDPVAITMLGGRSSSSNLVTKKGIMRPDARDLRNNVGGTLAEAIPINRRASIVAPAYGVQTLVTSFQVPQAMEAVINAILCKFDGAGFTQGSGEITWVIDINRPLGAGGAGLGYSPPDFSIITTQLGDNIQSGPWPVPGGIRLSERDTIRFKVTTGAPVGIGSPNLITCMFLGWYWPARLLFTVQG